jgi:hypothetical protein
MTVPFAQFLVMQVRQRLLSLKKARLFADFNSEQMEAGRTP